MGGFSLQSGSSSLPRVNTLDDVEQLVDSGALPAEGPSRDVLDSMPTPPPPEPLPWVDNGLGEPVAPKGLKTSDPDWYRVVFDDGSEMSAAAYRSWRAKNGISAPPSAIDRDGRPIAPTPQAKTAQPPPPSQTSPISSPPQDAAWTAEEERRRLLAARMDAEAARRSTIATSWRGVLTPPPTSTRRKTLLGE